MLLRSEGVDIIMAAERSIEASCCIVPACLADRISSNRAGVASFQDKIDLLTTKARCVFSRTRTMRVRSL
jgi:hypothetical protein